MSERMHGIKPETLLHQEYRLFSTPANLRAAKNIGSVLSQSKDIAILTHPNPDEDAIGSSLAAADIAQIVNPDAAVTVYLPSQPPFNYEYLLQDQNLKIWGNDISTSPDTVVITDIGDAKRIGDIITTLSPTVIVNIDHHQGSPGVAEKSLFKANLVDERFEAASEAMFWLSRQLSVPMTPSLATSILFGMFGDTEQFQDLNVSSRVDFLRYYLKRSGADENAIILNTIRGLDPNELHAISDALSEFHVEKEYAYAVIPYEKYSELTRNLKRPFEHALVVNMLRKIEGMEFAYILVEPEPGKVRGSFRSRLDTVNLATIAEQFGGGGHPVAAGFRQEGSLDEIADLVKTYCDSITQ